MQSFGFHVRKAAGHSLSSPQWLASTLQYLQVKKVCCKEKWNNKGENKQSVFSLRAWWLEPGNFLGMVQTWNRHPAGLKSWWHCLIPHAALLSCLMRTVNSKEIKQSHWINISNGIANQIMKKCKTKLSTPLSLSTYLCWNNVCSIHIIPVHTNYPL